MSFSITTMVISKTSPDLISYYGNYFPNGLLLLNRLCKVLSGLLNLVDKERRLS